MILRVNKDLFVWNGSYINRTWKAERIEVAQCCVQWRAVVTTAINFQVSNNRNFIHSLLTCIRPDYKLSWLWILVIFLFLQTKTTILLRNTLVVSFHILIYSPLWLSSHATRRHTAFEFETVSVGIQQKDYATQQSRWPPSIFISPLKPRILYVTVLNRIISKSEAVGRFLALRTHPHQCNTNCVMT
jgi:hypothetical protein